MDMDRRSTVELAQGLTDFAVPLGNLVLALQTFDQGREWLEATAAGQADAMEQLAYTASLGGLTIAGIAGWYVARDKVRSWMANKIMPPGSDDDA